MLDDEDLLARIRRAAREGVGLAEVEERVGETAWFNTARLGRGALSIRNLATDEDSGEQLPDLARLATDAVFWRRPLAAPNPRVIGIFWSPVAAPRVFFAVVLPP